MPGSAVAAVQLPVLPGGTGASSVSFRAASHSTSVQRGLGHVMAHEMGHVLLGVNSHSAEGLMRAAWEPWDDRVQTFTPSQVLQIRHRFIASVR